MTKRHVNQVVFNLVFGLFTSIIVIYAFVNHRVMLGMIVTPPFRVGPSPAKCLSSAKRPVSPPSQEHRPTLEEMKAEMLAQRVKPPANERLDWATWNATVMGRKSFQLQETALAAQRAAIEKRTLDQDTCITTFHPDSVSEEEKGFFLFTAPPPLKELPDAMKSWQKAMKGRGQYIIIANDPGTRKVAAEHGIPFMCVEHSDEGLPFFNIMLERMHDSQKDGGIVAYVNSDISIRDSEPLHRFLAGMAHREIRLMRALKLYEPYHDTGKITDDWFAVMTRINVAHNGTESVHDFGGFDFWAWNTMSQLLPFNLPHFRFPHASYDNWLLNVVVQVGRRNVIDMSGVTNIYHHEHKRIGQATTWMEPLLKGVSSVYMNRFLAYNEPKMTLVGNRMFQNVRYMNQFGTPKDCPHYVVTNEDGEFEMRNRTFWSNLPEISPGVLGCKENPRRCPEPQAILKATANAEKHASILPIAREHKAGGKLSTMEKGAKENWRYTFEAQLKAHANPKGFVLITAADYDDRDKLLNFKCGLERAGMYDHYVIVALDKKIYEWGVLRGLPIFLPTGCQTRQHESASKSCLKSSITLEALKAGYSVVWSDIDMTWFYHPFDALSGFLSPDAGIAIQSNAPYMEYPRRLAVPHLSIGDIPEPQSPAHARRLDASLFVAPNNQLVLSAFQEIVDHAVLSEKSERFSFDEILCNRASSKRRYSSCSYRSESSKDSPKLHIEVLDRFQFASGAVLVGSDNDNAFVLGRDLFMRATGVNLLAVHNNWIVGESQKESRLRESGLWFLDEKNFCEYRSNDE